MAQSLSSPFWFPTGAIRALPELFAGGIIEESAGPGIALHDGLGSISDVAEVAEHGALLAFFDRAVEFFVAADGFQKVGDVRRVATALALALADRRAFG